MLSGALSPIDQFIVRAAAGTHRPTADELQQIVAHVAQAGFDANARERVRGELAGMIWQGRMLKGSDRLPPSERHYLKHVLRRQEWPGGTNLAEYLDSLRATVLGSRTRVFASRYLGEAQLGVVGPSAAWQGPGGGRWIMVEYRPATGHWVTGYQFGRLRELKDPQRTNLLWLRGPR